MDESSPIGAVWQDDSGGPFNIIAGRRFMSTAVSIGSPAFCCDSKWVYFDGNDQECEADKRKRLGEEGAWPKRVRFLALK